MPIEFREQDGELLWVRNPFTGAVTYFTHVHKKRSGFVRHGPAPQSPSPEEAERDRAHRRAEMDAALAACPFCPGNEAATREEVLRRTEREIWSERSSDRWIIRAVRNIIPRIPESCTGGRNESYVVIEDPRHFVNGESGADELLHSGLLAPEQFQALLEVDVEVARLAYSNPDVRAVLVRKNQGPESGASQPHVHNQVIGSDIPIPVVEREAEVMRAHPHVWSDVIALAREHNFIVAERDGCVAYFCPFGTFPRSYEVVSLDDRARIVDIPPARWHVFVSLLRECVQLLGAMPLDYEIHDGRGVPLHAHINARHYPYSNIGGTLNLPSNLLSRPASPTR